MNDSTHETKHQHRYAELEQYRSRLMRHAIRMVRDSGYAEDLVQECLLKAWLARDGFRGESRLYTWLHRILLNTSYNYLKRPKHEVQFSAGWEDDNFLAVPDMETPEQQLIAKQRAQALLNSLEALSAPLAETFTLRYQQDLSYEEIADALQLPVGTVRSRLSRTHRYLGIK